MPLFTQLAVKEKLKARVAIDGPTGAGKTWTALQWARIIAGPEGKVGMIDTENRSGALYSPTPRQVAGLDPITRLNFFDPPYVFFHVPVRKPYDPNQLAKMIEVAGDELGENGVLIIDSLTHFWNAEGGTLDIVEKSGTRQGGGNKWAGWKDGTPAQRYMLDSMIDAPCHVIVTMRSKMEYVLEEQTNRSGNKVNVPVKVGMAPEQRAGIEYEFTVVADMELPSHRLIVSKSRCDVVSDIVAEPHRSHEPAQLFATWLDVGAAPITDDQVAELVGMFAGFPDSARAIAKNEFVAEFGPPAALLDNRLSYAHEWILGRLAPFTATDTATQVAHLPVEVVQENPGSLFIADTPITENEFDVDGDGQGHVCVVCGEPVEADGETCAACLDDLPGCDVNGFHWTGAQVAAYVREHGKHPNDPSTDAMWEARK